MHGRTLDWVCLSSHVTFTLDVHGSIFIRIVRVLCWMYNSMPCNVCSAHTSVFKMKIHQSSCWKILINLKPQSITAILAESTLCSKRFYSGNNSGNWQWAPRQFWITACSWSTKLILVDRCILLRGTSCGALSPGHMSHPILAGVFTIYDPREGEGGHFKECELK